MPSATQNHEDSAQGQDWDEVRERKRLQNRIAQRKFRERKANQQLLASIASSNTGISHSKALEEINLRGVPLEVLPWLGKICPNSGLPIPSALDRPSAGTNQVEEQGTPNNSMSRSARQSLEDVLQCNKCGRQLFSDTEDMCACALTTTQQPSQPAITMAQSLVSLGEHHNIMTTSHESSAMLVDSRPDDEFSFHHNGFPAEGGTDMSHHHHNALPSPQSTELATFMMTNGQLVTPPYHEDSSALASQSLPGGTRETNQPLFHVAVRHGHDNVVRTLIRHNFEIDMQDDQGATALHIAVRSQNESMISLLLQHGANANAKDHEGQTPLYLAVQAGYDNIVALLLSQVPLQVLRQQQGDRPSSVTV